MLRRAGLLSALVAATALTVSGVPAASSAAAGVLPTPLRVAIFGDSSGLMTANGLKAWIAQHPGQVEVVDSAVYYGCGLIRDGSFRHAGIVRPLDGCGDLATQWSRALDAGTADVALIQVGPIEVDDHLLPGDSAWRAPGDPVFDAYLEQKMLEAVDLLLSYGVTPVWVTSPAIEPPDGDVSRDPARMARFNEILRRVARVRPAMRIVDLARYVAAWPGGEFDPALRGDGVHFEPSTVAAYVAPWLVSAVRRTLETTPRPR
jgi:hypothetical protein